MSLDLILGHLGKSEYRLYITLYLGENAQCEKGALVIQEKVPVLKRVTLIYLG